MITVTVHIQKEDLNLKMMHKIQTLKYRSTMTEKMKMNKILNKMNSQFAIKMNLLLKTIIMRIKIIKAIINLITINIQLLKVIHHKLLLTNNTKISRNKKAIK